MLRHIIENDDFTTGVGLAKNISPICMIGTCSWRQPSVRSRYWQ